MKKSADDTEEVSQEAEQKAHPKVGHALPLLRRLYDVQKETVPPGKRTYNDEHHARCQKRRVVLEHEGQSRLRIRDQCPDQFIEADYRCVSEHDIPAEKRQYYPDDPVLYTCLLHCLFIVPFLQAVSPASNLRF